MLSVRWCIQSSWSVYVHGSGVSHTGAIPLEAGGHDKACRGAENIKRAGAPRMNILTDFQIVRRYVVLFMHTSWKKTRQTCRNYLDRSRYMHRRINGKAPYHLNAVICHLISRVVRENVVQRWALILPQLQRCSGIIYALLGKVLLYILLHTTLDAHACHRIRKGGKVRFHGVHARLTSARFFGNS